MTTTTDTTPNLDAILGKVRKLRELAARSTSLAEATTAAAQADAIIQRYRLSEADVEAAGNAPTEAIDSPEEPLWSGGARTDTVAMRLSAVLANHYGCVSYRERTRVGGRTESVVLRLAGRASDVAIVRYMFAWLRSEIERLAQREAGPARPSFRHGAVSGIEAALAASMRATVAARTQSGAGAMVLSSRAAEAQAWLVAALPEMGKARPVGGDLDVGAFARGVRAGREMPLGAALPEGRGRMLGRGESGEEIV